jgi:tetratricopeptide (TPR) repeat protein
LAQRGLRRRFSQVSRMPMTDTPTTTGRQPLPPNVRRRLQQMFEHGTRSSAKGDFQYATEMFTQCVTGDPGNLVYVSSFLGNLYKQYNDNKKGSKLAGVKGMTIKGSIKKASMQKDWNAVITNGVEMLKLNPWDKGALTEMATACAALEFDECQLAYLKSALVVDIKDPEVNRICARALGAQGKYDEAIICWNRVQQAKPQDEEARRAIGDLAVEKTIKHAGYEDAETSTEVMADKQAAAERHGSAGARLTAEQQLEKQISKDPSNTSLYLQLAEYHLKAERFPQAEEVLNKALQVSGGEINVRERLEDAQIRKLKSHVEIARKKAGEDKNNTQAMELYKQKKEELNNLELDVTRSRCERYPQNLQYKFDLGLKLQAAKKFQEAIKSFQEARNDPQRKGLVMLHLGECFQHIEQFKLAMTNYEQAVNLIDESLEDAKKLAYYRAGVLAMGLKDLDKADTYLTELAAREYGYKDVSDRLDKIRQLRDKS